MFTVPPSESNFHCVVDVIEDLYFLIQAHPNNYFLVSIHFPHLNRNC